MSTAFGDSRTIPASDLAKKMMKELTAKYYFDEQRDVWMLGAALGIVCGEVEKEGETRGTFQNVNSLDPEGIFNAIMAGLHKEKSSDERLDLLVNHAEWGIREIYRKCLNGTLDWSTLGIFKAEKKEDIKSVADDKEIILNQIKNLIDGKELETNKLVSPQKPFSNKYALEMPIRNSEEYIDWVDLYFSREGLKFLSDFLDVEKVKRIRIIRSVKNISKELRDDFKDFIKQFSAINCEMRIIIDSKIRTSIHDRWIISKNECYNVPSTDVIARGQYSEVKKTENRPPFDNWWQASVDIIEKWSEIEEIKKGMDAKKN